MLLDAGFKDITVLDIAEAGLVKTKVRLGFRADEITWVVADITAWHPEGRFDLWHDRAVFHFLTEAEAAAPTSRHCAARWPRAGM